MKPKIEFSIAIPLYNEEKNIKGLTTNLIEEFNKNRIDYQLVLVNNGSKDNTPNVVDKLATNNSRIKAVHIKKNVGYGWGILTGLKECEGRYLGYMWGDEQVKAEDVVKILKKIKKEDLDLCKSCRIERLDGLKRRIITKIYNWIFPLFYPVKTKDVNGCPKIFKRKVYEELNLVSRDWFIDAEIMIKSFQKRLKIVEIPIIFHPRIKGKSNVSYRTMAEFVKNLIKFKIKGDFK